MVARILSLIVLLFSGSLTYAQDYRTHFNQAIKSLEEGDNKKYLSELILANQQRQHHQTVMYHLAKAYALNDEVDSAISYLAKVIEIDAVNYAIETEIFQSLSKLQGYQDLLARRDFLLKPWLKADTLLVLNESDLHIEGVIQHPFMPGLLVSAINKRNIYTVEPSGKAEALLEKPLEVSPTAMKIGADATLWLVGMGIPEGGLVEKDAHFGQSYLYQIDLEQQKILSAYSINDGKQHLFGDLEITEDGSIYVSDSRANAVYQLKEEKLVNLVSDPAWLSIQGISSLNGHLIIADYVNGLFSYDLSENTLQSIANSQKVSMKGIDGLYTYDGGLVAIQNGVQPNKVVKLALDDELSCVKAYEFLEKHHPAFGEPTLGAIERDALIFVANSFWNENKAGMLEKDTLLKPVILKLDLSTPQASEAILFQEKIKILNGKKEEAIYYYRNNWEAFRKHAKERRWIQDYSLKLSSSQEDEFVLETLFADSSQFWQIEKHFKEWATARTGPILLNEISPSEFRLSQGSQTFLVLADGQMQQSISSACDNNNARAFDFWIGNWNVYDTAGNKIGHNKISLIEGGCGLREEWIGSRLGYSGSSYNYFDPTTSLWNQLWIDSQGAILQLKGGMKGEEMVMKSDPTNLANGGVLINRITWKPVSANEVVQCWERSTDGGKSWDTIFKGLYEK